MSPILEHNLQTILSLVPSLHQSDSHTYTFIPLSRLFPFSFVPSFLSSHGGVETKLPAIRDNLSGFFLWPSHDTGREGGYFYMVARLVPPTKINAFMDHFGECVFGKFSSFNARRTLHPVTNVASKHIGGGNVQWMARLGGGEFFCTRWKFVATFKRGFLDNRDWEIAVPGRRSRFLEGIFRDGGFEAVRDSNYRTSNYAFEERFGIEWKDRDELISSPRIYIFLYQFVS